MRYQWPLWLRSNGTVLPYWHEPSCAPYRVKGSYGGSRLLCYTVQTEEIDTGLGDGWGLTTDGVHLIVSESSQVRVCGGEGAAGPCRAYLSWSFDDRNVCAAGTW